MLNVIGPVPDVAFFLLALLIPFCMVLSLSSALILLLLLYFSGSASSGGGQPTIYQLMLVVTHHEFIVDSGFAQRKRSHLVSKERDRKRARELEHFRIPPASPPACQSPSWKNLFGVKHRRSRERDMSMDDGGDDDQGENDSAAAAALAAADW